MLSQIVTRCMIGGGAVTALAAVPNFPSTRLSVLLCLSGWIVEMWGIARAIEYDVSH